MKRTTAFVVFSLIVEICNAQTNIFELSLIHMNSFHARFDEIYPDGSTCHPGDECIGGLARVATEAKRIKKENKNSIFLNAGNNYQGTIWYKYHKWEIVAFFMNMLQHDAMTIGPYEFDDGIDGLVPFLKDVRAPVVLTNIDDTLEPNFQGLTDRSTIIVCNGRKIGVIGAITPKEIWLKNTGKLKFLYKEEAINRETEKLRKNHNVNIIVVLSNSGTGYDKNIAAACPDVDLIVQGSMRHKDLDVFEDELVGGHPFLIIEKLPNTTRQSDGLLYERKVLIFHAAAYTKYLGHITLRFNENGEIVGWKNDPILLDRNIIPDPQIIKALKPWKDEVEGLGNLVIGTTKGRLAHNNYWLECSLANLITDAMVQSWIDQRQTLAHWTYAAVSFIMPGYMWFSIGRDHITEYNITLSDLITAIPRTSTWDVVEVRGGNIIRMLEWSVAYLALDKLKGRQRFIHWSGLKAEFDLNREPYHRLVRATIRCQKCVMPRYENINANQIYRVVVDSFYLGNGKQRRILAQPYDNRQVGKVNYRSLIDFFRRYSPINYGIENRVNFL